jgi:hypothetical protein
LHSLSVFDCNDKLLMVASRCWRRRRRMTAGWT